MSRHDLTDHFDMLAGELSGLIDDALDRHDTDGIGNVRMGQLMASLGRVYAEKVQNGEVVRPFGLNSRPTVTDVAIVCTAMMDAVGLEVFELGGWQTMSGGLGKLTNANDSADNQEG